MAEWHYIAFRKLVMKVEGGDQINLSVIEDIIREATAEAEIVAQMKRALESGDDAAAMKLARQLCQLPEEKTQ